VVENVLEAMVDAVLVVNAEGRITRANHAAADLSGYTAAELQGRLIKEMLVDESDGLKTVVRRRIEDGDILRRESSWLVTKDGQRIPVSVTGSPVLTNGGMLEGIVLVARDVRAMRQLLADREAEIVRRKQAEAELRAAKSSIEDQLEQTRTQLLLSERRATLGTLAGGVGHELRNVAQVQIAAVDELRNALERGDNLHAVVADLLPDLARVGDHITEHGGRMMRLARPGPDRVGPIDFCAIVREVVHMLSGAGKLRRHKAVFQLPPSLTVTVNRTRIEQILVNLLVNAVDAMSAPGTITISAGERGERIVCTVSDTGSGILPEHMDKVFEPFFSTKAEAGTGLGLPVAREIVQSYGGKLIVESAIGKGTAFSFDLPI
jgi:PAS domain S-box-containing protein